MARYGSRHAGKQDPSARPTPRSGRRIVTTRLTEDTYEKLFATAAATNISAAALLSELVERLEPGPDGALPWQSRYAPPPDEQEALDMSA